MRILQLIIRNFRGIKQAKLLFNEHTVLVGDNNTGKSTVIEAIDLVLGPERLSRYPIIDEHDFYAGQYLSSGEESINVNVEVVVGDLMEEQQRHFRNHLEWWDSNSNTLITGPPEETDQAHVLPALRIQFSGYYDKDEDDFAGDTVYASPQNEDGSYSKFGRLDKRKCGFLFLRTLRTGSRALSLEKGSLLDIILRLQELRPQMWEDILSQLRDIPVAEDPELGISSILESVQKGVRSFVPSEWAINPHLKVSDLTRVHLRKLLTVFMDTGEKDDAGVRYAAPFQHQGTGTINTLVLTLLSIIAELKQNVIFAMEEPEIAIPPHTQKRIVDSVISKAAQAIFTSHSPYVLEEFKPENILVVKRKEGELTGIPATYPPNVKPKKYREEFKRRFCETLLARRVLITEGRTEFDAFPTAARRLHDLNSVTYASLEAMGIAIINAETDSQVEPLGRFYKDLGKEVFAVFDQQAPEISQAIAAAVNYPFEAPENTFEKVILNGTSPDALKRFALSIVHDWPTHLMDHTPSDVMTTDEIKAALKKYFSWAKGSGSAADLLAQCGENEMPEYIKDVLARIKEVVEPALEAEINEDENNT